MPTFKVGVYPPSHREQEGLSKLVERITKVFPPIDLTLDGGFKVEPKVSWMVSPPWSMSHLLLRRIVSQLS